MHLDPSGCSYSHIYIYSLLISYIHVYRYNPAIDSITPNEDWGPWSCLPPSEAVHPRFALLEAGQLLGDLCIEMLKLVRCEQGNIGKGSLCEFGD